VGAKLTLNPVLTEEATVSLRAGEPVQITGELLTARDAACKRLVEALEANEPLPVDLKGRVIYAVGPTPAKPGQVIGSAGPTTASRLLPYLPRLLDAGVKGLIGTGNWPEEAAQLFSQHGAVYFAAIGGAAAVISKSIKAVEIVAYEDLGTEAVRRLQVEDFPATVAIDTQGHDMFVEARRKWARS
jgi:fumarate hydratase subunit beta